MYGHGPHVYAKGMMSPINWPVVTEHAQELIISHERSGLGMSPTKLLPQARGKTEG